MNRLQIEWGSLHRTEAIEADIQEKAEKILSHAPEATNLVVHLQITNPKSSAGVSAQRVSMELRLPHHQDVRAEKEGTDLYKSIREVEQIILHHLEAKKPHHR